MSKLLPNLVMVLAFALCGLCVFQWKKEGQLRDDLRVMNDDVYKKKETIQGLEFTIRQDREEIARLDEARKELTQTKLAQEKQISDLTKEADRLVTQKANLEEQIERYKEAVATANERILKQNEDIKKQNDVIKQVAEQRDAKAGELAKVVEEYNKLVADYNKLVEDVNKMNEANAAAAAAQQDNKRK